MPANQYDKKPTDEKKSPEMSRPIEQAETLSSTVVGEAIEPKPQHEKERSPEHSHGYGY